MIEEIKAEALSPFQFDIGDSQGPFLVCRFGYSQEVTANLLEQYGIYRIRRGGLKCY